MAALYILLALVVLAMLYVLAGIRVVEEEEWWIVERFGKYYKTMGKGIRFVAPGIMKVRKILQNWEQTWPLFEAEGHETKIDFVDGSAAPVGTRAYIKIFDPKKAMYAISDVQRRSVSLLENATRSYLNGLTIEEGLEGGRSGYDIIKRIEEADSTKKDEIVKALCGWGIELIRVTMSDLALDEAIIKAREGIVTAESEKAAAKYQKEKILSNRIDLMEEIAQSLMDKGWTKKEAREFAKQFTIYVHGTGEKAIVDWRGSGGGSFAEIAAQIAVAFSKTNQPSQ